MKYIIEVKADTNDGDYITQITTISEDHLVIVRYIMGFVKNCKDHFTWPNSEYRSESLGTTYPELAKPISDEHWPLVGNWSRCTYLEFIDELWVIPYGEHGVHSIESVKVYPEVKKEVLI